jgi:uncharacterized protein (DUF1015 family)
MRGAVHLAGAGVVGLDISPFRGVRFAPDRVTDLAAATSPPYDVIDAADARRLEAAEPHNVVRLILPRADEAGPEGPYRHAAATLSSWLEDGTLVRDPAPAVYGYEQRTENGRHRGLIAAFALPDGDGVVLPHENVSASVVEDRLALLRATAANLEPILLVTDPAPRMAALLDATATDVPTADATTPDGCCHRLWAISDPDVLAPVIGELGSRSALLVDGHHRYAASSRLRAERRAAGAGPGPWDLALGLFVDPQSSPLELRAIPRTVSGLSLAAAVAAIHPAGNVTALPWRGAAEPNGDLAHALAALAAAGRDGPAFVVTDGSAAVLIHGIDPDAVSRALPGQRSAAWRGLDSAILHCLLLDRLWGVPPEAVAPVHEPAEAVSSAVREAGVAVLLNPPTLAQVRAVAAAGERMPQKSTWFTPKPRSGLVLRLFDEV